MTTSEPAGHTDCSDRIAPATRWEHRRAGWLVVAVAVLVFAPTLALGRVAFDDEWLWSDDSPLRTPSIAMLAHVWLELDVHARRDLGSEYLPVRDLVVAADMALWGGNEHGLHATQLLLYALTVLGLGGLLVRFGLRRDLAWLATLLWAIHPIHVESVAWLSERKGVLAGLFVVACGHAWIRYRLGGRRAWLALAVIAAVAGTWSKAPAMFAPAVFAAWDLLLLTPARRRWMAIGAIGGATALAAIPVVLLARDAGVVDSRFEVAPDGRLVSALGAQGHYVESLVLVRPPSVSYPIQTSGAAPIDLALGALAVLGSVALAVDLRGLRLRGLRLRGLRLRGLRLRGLRKLRLRGPRLRGLRELDQLRPRGRHCRWRLAFLAWTWIWFLPVSHLIAAVHIAVADRFAYLWCLAGCAGAAWLVLRLHGPARLAVTGVLVCVLGIATLRAQAAWTTAIDLFGHAFAESPDDPVAVERLVQELFSAGHRAEALAVIDRGLEARPEHPYLLARKARMLDAIGHRTEALAAAERAARSGHASTMSLYAELLAHAGRAAEALGFAERAAQRRPENPAYARSRIEILIALGRFVEADPIARELCVSDPRALNHIVLGRVLAGRGELAEARRELDLAIAMGARDEMLAVLRVAIERASADRGAEIRRDAR